MLQHETTFQPLFEESMGEAHLEALELLSSEKDLLIRSKLPHIHVTKVFRFCLLALVVFKLPFFSADKAGRVLRKALRNP